MYVINIFLIMFWNNRIFFFESNFVHKYYSNYYCIKALNILEEFYIIDNIVAVFFFFLLFPLVLINHWLLLRYTFLFLRFTKMDCRWFLSGLNEIFLIKGRSWSLKIVFMIDGNIFIMLKSIEISLESKNESILSSINSRYS